MFRVLSNTVKIEHEIIAQHLSEGAVVVDATVGNGHDTLFLARCAGETGKVYGFDIQEKAIENTRELLKREDCLQTVTLHKTSHENMKRLVNEPVDLIVFNLGYLPGGDRNIITTPDATLEAVAQGLSLLKPGGLMSIVIYTGHSGGQEERDLLESFLSGLDKKSFCVGKLYFINREQAPYLIMVEKSAGGQVS